VAPPRRGAALVNDVLTTLSAAQRHSKLPGSLGEWSDQQFLTIRFTKPASEEDLRAASTPAG
jgi:hypothetical protein